MQHEGIGTMNPNLKYGVLAGLVGAVLALGAGPAVAQDGVITNARIIVGNGQVIENGTIVIQGNRITAVGRTGAVTVPAGARTIDLAGKTIIPGMIDAHAHGSQGDDDIVPNQNWSAIAHLALGVTTVFDPSSTASEIFVAEEMQRAGLILASRIFSTGEIVYGARSPGTLNDIKEYEDALAHIQRLKAQGAAGIKNYNQPRRNQRQRERNRRV